MIFNEKLRRLLEDRNRVAVARRAGMAATSLGNYLNRGSVPSISIAVRIAHALNVSVGWLVDDSQGWPPAWTNAPEQQSQVA